MPRMRFETVLVVLISFAGCATTQPPSARLRLVQSSKAAAPPTAASFRVLFKGGYAYAEENGQSWRIAEVTRNEMLWAPDGMRFAYLMPAKGPGNSTDGQAKAKVASPAFRVVIRNIRGDSVNAFPVYRAGKPSELEWIDDRVICYLAPPDRTGSAYVVHEAGSGEIVSVYRGNQFAWSPGKKRLAYVAGKRRRQVIKVNDEQVWPRKRDRARRKIVSSLVWSPDGSGLAFLERNRTKARLVVLLVVDNKDGDLTWEIPRRASGGKNKLFWAESKVLIGESTFKPRFAASWTRTQ